MRVRPHPVSGLPQPGAMLVKPLALWQSLQESPECSSVAPAAEALPEELEWPCFCTPVLRDIWHIPCGAGLIAHTHAHTHAHMHTHVHTHMHTCTHTHTHPHMHTCMHTCTHAHMHTCTQSETPIHLTNGVASECTAVGRPLAVAAGPTGEPPPGGHPQTLASAADNSDPVRPSRRPLPRLPALRSPGPPRHVQLPTAVGGSGPPTPAFRAKVSVRLCVAVWSCDFVWLLLTGLCVW